MYKKKLTIRNKTGLHARPASEMTALCRKFQSDIKLITAETVINPKSVVSILTGGLVHGTVFTLEIEGVDEEEAGLRITNYINTLQE